MSRTGTVLRQAALGLGLKVSGVAASFASVRLALSMLGSTEMRVWLVLLSVFQWITLFDLGFEQDLPQQFGEIYVIKGAQGKVRANHYHDLATDWFTLLQGVVWANLRHVDTGSTASLLLSERTPVTVRVNRRVAHSLLGVEGQACLLMAYTDVRYDAEDAIAHPPILL